MQMILSIFQIYKKKALYFKYILYSITDNQYNVDVLVLTSL